MLTVSIMGLANSTKQLPKAFDRGTFIIVPIETAMDKPQRYKLVLMNEQRRNEHVISLAGSEGIAVKWRDLDKR